MQINSGSTTGQQLVEQDVKDGKLGMREVVLFQRQLRAITDQHFSYLAPTPNRNQKTRTKFAFAEYN